MRSGCESCEGVYMLDVLLSELETWAWCIGYLASCKSVFCCISIRHDFNM